MADHAADHEQNDPVTLHRVIQSMIGQGLKTHYQPPPRLSHELFVLLLQIKEQERSTAATAKEPPSRPKRPARRKLSVAEALPPL
jgi:hypothetical protein